MATADYVEKESRALIADKMQQIVDTEAPITYDQLIKNVTGISYRKIQPVDFGGNG